MIQVASSFSTDPSLDVVLASIPAQIYEAIHLLKENMDTFTAKVSLILTQYLIRFGKLARIVEVHTLNLRIASFVHRPANQHQNV